MCDIDDKDFSEVTTSELISADFVCRIDTRAISRMTSLRPSTGACVMSMAGSARTPGEAAQMLDRNVQAFRVCLHLHLLLPLPLHLHLYVLRVRLPCQRLQQLVSLEMRPPSIDEPGAGETQRFPDSVLDMTEADIVALEERIRKVGGTSESPFAKAPHSRLPHPHYPYTPLLQFSMFLLFLIFLISKVQSI